MEWCALIRRTITAGSTLVRRSILCTVTVCEVVATLTQYIHCSRIVKLYNLLLPTAPLEGRQEKKGMYFATLLINSHNITNL